MRWIVLLIVQAMMESKEPLPPLLVLGEQSECALKGILVTSLQWEGGRGLTLENQKLRSWLDVG